LDSSFDAASAGADGYVDGPLWDDDIVDVVLQALGGTHPVRRPARPATAPAPSVRDRVLSPRIRAVKDAIDNAPGLPLSVGDLAARVECSESTISHQFRAELGVTIPQYRRERRLLQAADLLVTTLRSVREIAFGAGYRPLSLMRFRRDFRKRFGMSPKEYRKRHWRGSSQSR
jgi:AraC-like DNA-binding protein